MKGLRRKLAIRMAGQILKLINRALWQNFKSVHMKPRTKTRFKGKLWYSLETQTLLTMSLCHQPNFISFSDIYYIYIYNLYIIIIFMYHFICSLQKVLASDLNYKY